MDHVEQKAGRRKILLRSKQEVGKPVSLKKPNPIGHLRRSFGQVRLGGSRKKHDNFLFLKLFLGFLLLAVFLSLFLKFINQVKKSSFNKNYYNILLLGSKNYLFNIKDEEKKLSIFNLGDLSDLGKENEFRFKIGAALGAPVDAVLTDEGNLLGDNWQDIFSTKSLYLIFSKRNSFVFYNLNKYDLLQVYKNLALVSSSRTKVFDNNLLDQDSWKDIGINDFLKDVNIVNEKISIQIVNASLVNGLGAKIANMLENVGFTILSIDTADEKDRSQIIRRTKESYSSKRLENIFMLPSTVEDGSSITDITIILGKDFNW